MRPLTTVLLCLGLSAASADPSQAADQPIRLTVTFSTDDGATWAEQPPTLSQSGQMKIKVSWSFADPTDVKTGFRVVKLICLDGDFASANNGYHGSWKPKGWYQRSDIMLKDSGSVVLEVSTAARPAGVLGDDNVWSGGKFVDGMLPACEALAAGPHSFQVKFDYVDRGRDRRLSVEKDFTLAIADAQGNVPAVLPAPQPKPRTAPRRASAPKKPVPAPELEFAGPTLYVDVNHVDANDTNGGTSPEKPLKTIRRALELVQHGGMIRIAAGTYREGDLALRKSGTAKFPLTIQGAGMDQTFIKGSKAIPQWQPVDGTPGLYKVSWQTNVQQMWADGKALQQIGVRSAWNTKVLWADTVCLPPIGKDVSDVKPGSFYHDGLTATLYCMLPDKANPAEHLVEAGDAIDGLSGSGTSYVVLRDLSIMQNNGTGNANKSRLLGLGDHHWTVENCRIADGEFMGIGWNGPHHTLRNSQVLRNGDTGIDMSNTDAAHGWKWYENAPAMHALVEGCLFEGNNARGFYTAWHAGAMKCIPGCRKVTVRNNIFRNNDAPAVWFDHAHGQIDIVDNIMENNKKGVFYEISAAGPGDSYGAFIANNRISGSVQQAIFLSASCDSFVLNNTLTDNWVNIALHGMPRKQWKLKNNTVKHNIIGPASKGQLMLFVGTDAVNNIVDHNFYVTGAGGGVNVGMVTGKGYDANKRTWAAVQAGGIEADGSHGAGHADAQFGWQATGCPHSPPPPVADDPTLAEDQAASGDTASLVNAEFSDKAAAGGAAGWRPESHGIWQEDGDVQYIHLLPKKHINQQPMVNPAWKQLRLTVRLRIPEIHPGPTERDAAGFRLRFVDANGKLIQPTPHWMFRQTTDGWQMLEKVLDIPAKASQLKMTVAIYCKGQMDVDYIHLEPVEK